MIAPHPSTTPSHLAAEIPFGKRACSLAELRKLRLEPAEPLIENLIYKGETASVNARPKTGKTLFQQLMGVCVAKGKPFLGFRVPRPEKVLYIDLENKPEFIRDRFERIAGDDLEAVQNRIFIYALESMSQNEVGISDSGMVRLTELVEDCDPGLIVIDPYRLIAEGKENESQDIVTNLKALSALQSLGRKRAIVLVHHLRKEDFKNAPTTLRSDPQQWLDKISGSHAFVAHTDAAYGLERDTQLESYTFGGVRRNGPAPSLILEFDPESLRFQLMADKDSVLRDLFSGTEREFWHKLPDQFTWGEAERIAGTKGRKISTTIRKATQNNLLTKSGNLYKKIA